MRKPDLAPFATYIARHAGSRYVYWLGPDATAFPRLGRDLVLIGVDRPDRIATLFARPGGTFLGHDFDERPLVVAHDSLSHAIVVCNDLLARESARVNVLTTLQLAVARGATAIVTVPGPGSGRRDALESGHFASILTAAGLTPTFSGRTATDDVDFAKTTLIAVVEPESRRPNLYRAPPDSFKVVAVITAFNEADIIDDVIAYLHEQGILVHFIDNWSTDETEAIVAARLDRGVVAIERIPPIDTASFDLEKVLIRMEQLSSVLDADWFVHYDADEIRRSAFRGVDLRSAIYAVDRAGYNAVDFTVLNFRPIDDSYVPGTSLERHFDHFEFGKTTDHLRQRKAWKNLGRTVALTERAGHDVLFTGRRVFPFKFMNKHYPVQSQAHGERKVVHERHERFNRRERLLRNWHVHYENAEKAPNFIVDPGKLIRFDDATFHEEYLVERLTGVGSLREPGFADMFLNHHGESV
jgi:glycosyltransferase involved in cell wall biosynthesis